MTICQACRIEIISGDRYCRNCGALVATFVGDLTDTRRLNATDPSLSPPLAPWCEPSDQSYSPSAASTSSFLDSKLTRKASALIKSLVKKKTVWVGVFLAVSVVTGTGIIVGRDVVRGRIAERVERAVQAERIRQAERARQAQIALRSSDKATQNALGFQPAPVSSTEYPGMQGVFVASLTSDDSPAALATIQAGDVLIEIADHPVRNNIELAQTVTSLKPGMDVSVKVYRDGETISSRIKVADLSSSPFKPITEARDEGYLGVGNVSRRCCLPGTGKWGLEVQRIVDNSPADLSGIQLGDVISEFDKHPVRTGEELSRRIRAAKPRSKVTVKFYRGSTQQTVELILGHGW